MKLLAPFFALGILLTSCSAEETEPLTIRETLEETLEVDLTSEEVTDLLETADVLCAVDDAVLETMWAQMDSEELAFQDFVFSTHCEERNETYVLATGRLDSAINAES